MEITVLGKSPAMPDAGGACSGYLVTEAGHRLLLDCGTGVFAKLRMQCEPTEVDTILISHMHADHIADLLPFGHALMFPFREFGRRPRLLLPPGGTAKLDAISEIFGVGYQLEHAFRVEEYDPEQGAHSGSLAISFQEVPHYIRTWACELTGLGGARFTFGADCAPNQQLADFAHGSDLLMLEATEGTIAHVQPDDVRGHMTAQEAGQLGRGAQARRLVLTHFSDLLDSDHVRAAGEVGFGSGVELAHAGAVFVV